MATSNPNPGRTTSTAASDPGLLVLLATMPQEQLEHVLANLASSFPADGLIVATRDPLPPESYLHLGVISLPSANPSWTLTATDFVDAYQLAGKNEARAILMLGPGSASLSSSAMSDLANAVLAASTDLAVPFYDQSPNAGLLNSAILYPLSRALFACRARFPLAIDLGLSLRMAERLSGVAQHFIAQNQSDAPLWPINEAVGAGFTVNEYAAGPRALPLPVEPDLNTILPMVTGYLFSDIEAKAAIWQRARPLPPARNSTPMAHAPSTDGMVDITSMLQTFRLAYTNLQEIWSLVLPPNSLLGLKRLSVTDGAAFRMPENLWARIVFDFLLAYRLRTINRGHLLGALIPLYLAWVASHINIIASGTEPERHIEAVAYAFEIEKPYIVSRWRWPDRFNP